MRLLSSHRGSAILVSLIVLILITITTTVFLEKIWGFSQSSNGIEASNKAYYNAIGLIEQQLMDPNVTKYQPWNITETGSLAATFWTGGKLTVYTGDTMIPSAGKGNSPFDSDYNIISLGEPVQLVIPDGINWNNVNFYFRVPQIGSAGTWVDNAYSSSWAILWTLGYTGASLFASGETSIFSMSELNDIPIQMTNAKFSGTTNSWSSAIFTDFYGWADYLGTPLGSKCTWYSCTLKLSLIRPIHTSDTYPSWIGDGRSLPFLEYRIEFTQFPNIRIPSQYMILQSDAYAYGFMRSRTVRIPQITTSTALDFAVLQ
jgi:hypothetical protein